MFVCLSVFLSVCRRDYLFIISRACLSVCMKRKRIFNSASVHVYLSEEEKQEHDRQHAHHRRNRQADWQTDRKSLAEEWIGEYNKETWKTKTDPSLISQLSSAIRLSFVLKTSVVKPIRFSARLSHCLCICSCLCLWLSVSLHIFVCLSTSPSASVYVLTHSSVCLSLSLALSSLLSLSLSLSVSPSLTCSLLLQLPSQPCQPYVLFKPLTDACFDICMHACLHLSMCIVYVCMCVYVSMCVCRFGYMYACMHICIHIIYVCMCACM